MAYCSNYRLEISDESGAYTADPNQVLLFDIDDILDREISSEWSSLAQDSQPIDADAAIVRGRGGAARILSFSVRRDHVDVETARRFLWIHEASLPSRTISARLLWASDEAPPGTWTADSGFESTRVHIESVSGEITGGSETVHRYVLRWGL